MSRPWTIRDLMDALQVEDPEAQVCFDFVGCVPTHIASWRGSYDMPALGWEAAGYSGNGKAPAAEDLWEELEKSLHRTYEGWKGGSYRYSAGQILRVDNRGDCTGTVIVGLHSDGPYVTLLTRGEL